MPAFHSRRRRRGDRFPSSVTLVALMLAGAASLPAHAAEDGAAPDAAGDIVVTAQRRSEKLRDVPMSITAISADTLSRSGANNITDIAKLSAGVVMPMFGTNLQPAIRGVSSSGGGRGDSANVALYIDGVYQPQQVPSLIDLPDVKQVEVLKGPQGTLYGQNATGGAILVTTETPNFTPTGKLSASYGNYNAVTLRGYVSAPVASGIAVSLAGGYQDRDGFRRNILTGERDSGLKSKVVRGKLLIEPAAGGRITLSGYYSDRHDSSIFASQALNNNSIGYLFVPAAPKATSAKQFSTNPDAGAGVTLWGFDARGEFDLPIGTLSSTTSWTRSKASWLVDTDYSPVDYIEGPSKLRGRNFIQELNFALRRFGAFGVLVGAFYQNSRDEGDPTGSRIYVASLPPTDPVVAAYSPTRSWLDKKAWAVYLDATANLTDRLVLTAGGRYSHETQQGFSNRVLPAPDQLVVVADPRGKISWSRFTPRATLRYAVTPQSNVYASFTQGFKSGLIVPNNLAQAPLKPETITSYEVGYKGAIAPGLSVGAASFHYDYKDLQVLAFTGTTTLTQNAASARIKGIDLDASWAVDSHLSLSASASFLDGKFRHFDEAQIFIPNGTGNISKPVDLSGHRMHRAPKFTGSFSATYDWDWDVGHLRAFASVYRNSGYGFEVSNRVGSGAFTTVDGELSLAPAALQGIRLVLWAKNLTDKAYLAGALVSALADGVTYAEPRTFGGRVEFQF